MTLPVLAKKVKKLASFQLFNLKLLINGESGRGFSKFKKNYKLKGELGRGGFGIVYRAIRISDEMPVAVKFIDRRSIREWGKIGEEQVPMEICMLAKCSKMRGVIRLLDWFSIPEGYLIVMERPYPCIDMFDFIKGAQKLDEEMTRFLFRQVVQTVQECAQKKVLHRDLKDENIVIDLATGETRLIDFGAATVLKKSHYTDFQGTRLYCPPEWFLHSLYLGREAAVWSLGVLLYNSLNGKLPFRNEKDICTAHLLGPLPYFTSVSAEAKDLISRCLSFDPFTRCTLEDILSHPWLQETSPEWSVLSASKSSNAKEASSREEDDREHSEVLEEINEDSEKENHNDADSDGTHPTSSEGESGVGSSASTITTRTHPTAAPAGPRISKTSLLVPPSSAEIKEVVQNSKTKSVSQSPAADKLRPKRSHRAAAPNPPQSTVLTALRRAMSRERLRRVDPNPRA